MEAAAVDIFVLNYNGNALLAECLPSLLRAAAASRHACRVVVIDNASTDNSLALLERQFPSVVVRRMPNRGLCSFNQAVAESTCRVAVLLNNDVKAADDAIDPLIEPLLGSLPGPPGTEPIAITAPRCFLFDGVMHEGFQTAVQWRYGLVQATAHFDGATNVATMPGPTASVGAAMAVDRGAFLAVGGFDDAYLPGRIEDLDFAYRTFQAGLRAVYVPTSVFEHRGAATFAKTFGPTGCDDLALRNTLVFQWRHLRSPSHLAQQWLWLPIRALRDVVQAPFVPAERRFAFCKAFRSAYEIIRKKKHAPVVVSDLQREREFFARHAPEQLAHAPIVAEEATRDQRYPISRLFWRPVAQVVARRLAKHSVHPNYVTAVGLAFAVAAAAALVAWPHAGWIAASLIAASWFCDRVDGPLSRLQNASGPLGAWIDANVDEFVDLGLHIATAGVASRLADSPQPWFWLIAFLVGKYLLMHGLASDEELTASPGFVDRPSGDDQRRSLWKTLYHLPANADVRAHLLIVAVASGCLTLELAFIAIYYNLRWPIRYFLLARRFRTLAAGATP